MKHKVLSGYQRMRAAQLAAVGDLGREVGDDFQHLTDGHPRSRSHRARRKPGRRLAATR